jgi:hypothetical protein
MGEFLHLQPATGFEVLESLTEQIFLLNNAVELSRVDEVELFFEDPWLFRIIN